MNHIVWDEDGKLVARFTNKRNAEDFCIAIGGFRAIAPDGVDPEEQLQEAFVEHNRNPLGLFLGELAA